MGPACYSYTDLPVYLIEWFWVCTFVNDFYIPCELGTAVNHDLLVTFGLLGLSFVAFCLTNHSKLVQMGAGLLVLPLLN